VKNNPLRYFARLREALGSRSDTRLLNEQLRAAREALEQLQATHARDQRHFEQIVDVLTQIAMRDPAVTDAQRALVAKALSKYDDWSQALAKIAALDPAAAGLKRSLLGNFKWIVANNFHMHQAVEALLSQTTFVIADIGAQLLDSQDHIYSPLTRKFPCHIIGFEPLQEELERRHVSDIETVLLPYFIGDGSARKFYETAFNPASSNFAPDFEFLGQFHALKTMLEVVNESEVTTHRMDDIEHLRDIDFLKIDVQGSELACLRGGEQTLENVVAIDVEIEFAQVYRNQPLHHEVDSFLRERGFVLMDFRDPGYLTYSENPAGYGGSRLGWADAVYFKSDAELAKLEPGKTLKAAAIAHYVYSTWDFAAHLFRIHDERSGGNTSVLYQSQLRDGIFSFDE